MKKPFWVKWMPKEALDGMNQLGPWSELAYRRIIDHIYTTEDNLIDDDEQMGWITKCGENWSEAKKRLIKQGKIEIINGRISNKKCRDTLADSKKRIKQTTDASRLAGEARKRKKKNNNSSVGKSSGLQNQNQSQSHKVKGYSSNELVNSPVSANGRDMNPKIEFCEAVLELWSSIMHDEGKHILPVPRILTEARKSSIMQRRRKELKTLESWKAYFVRIRRSRFLTGQKTRWKATFDWSLKPANLAKVLEGNYDDEQPNGPDDGERQNPFVAAALEIERDEQRAQGMGTAGDASGTVGGDQSGEGTIIENDDAV